MGGLMIKEANRLRVEAIRNIADLYNAVPLKASNYPPALLIPVTDSCTIGATCSDHFLKLMRSQLISNQGGGMAD